MRLMLDDRCSAMPWDVIDNVVFDVGNVLLTFRPEELLRTILPDSEADYPTLKKCMFYSPYWPMFDRGAINTEEAILCMSARHGALRPQIERIMRSFNDHLQVMDEGVEALHACKAHGKRCYVLSNYAAAPFDASCQKHPDVFSLFDGMVVSGQLGMIKPDQRIFRHLLDTYKLDPERTLFIDDSAANIESALNCGMQAVHYDEPGKLRAFLR